MKYDNGCVLHFKNVGEQTSREDLKVEGFWNEFIRDYCCYCYYCYYFTIEVRHREEIYWKPSSNVGKLHVPPPSPPSMGELSGEELVSSSFSVFLPASLNNAKDNDSNWGDMIRFRDEASEFLKIFFSSLLIKAEYLMSRNEKLWRARTL